MDQGIKGQFVVLISVVPEGRILPGAPGERKGARTDALACLGAFFVLEGMD
jgi:hypothetical protein